MSALLQQHLANPLNLALDSKLTHALYHDVTGEEWFSSNQRGTDIIGQQLELRFDSDLRLYLSWANVKGWSQYSLSASRQSFCAESAVFTASPDYWQVRIGKQLTSYSVYGYQESTWYTTGGVVDKVRYNEPHLVVLHFEDEVVAVANWRRRVDSLRGVRNQKPYKSARLRSTRSLALCK